MPALAPHTRASPPPVADQPTLEQQLIAFRQSRFLALPLAGLIAWAAIAVAGALLPLPHAVLAVYLGTGSIFYLGIGLGRLLGEDVLARDRRGNFFDRIFLGALGSALCVFAIAIPFGIRDPSAVPLAVGVLSGIMWLPMSVLLGHWVGYFHALTRSALLVTAWYVFPNDRFVALPLVIVAVYVVSLCALQARWQALQPTAGRPPGRSSARRRLLLSLAMGVGLGSSLGVALDNAAVGASVGIAGAMVFYVVRCRPLS